MQLLLCVCPALLLFPKRFLLAILRQYNWRLGGPLIWPSFTGTFSHFWHFLVKPTCFAVPEKVRIPQLSMCVSGGI